MAKVTLNNLSNLTNQQTAVNTINNNNDSIEAAIENTLSRDGTSPNNMNALLDMNSYPIINLPEPETGTEPVRLNEFEPIRDIVNSLESSTRTGTATDVATKEAATLMSFDDGISYIVTQGYSSVGDGGGALYLKKVSEPVHNGKFQSADGKWWELVAPELYTYIFGAKGDNLSASATANRIAIQSAIDMYVYASTWGITPKSEGAILGYGKYYIDEPIHLGWGDGFKKSVLTGLGSSYSTDLPGSTIIPTFSNAPAINIQGARRSRLANLTLLGPNTTYLQNNAMGLFAPAIDDTLIANWWDPSLSANGNSRYAPSVGVAVDAYSGTTPSPAYPTYSVPSYVTIASQYSRPPSSDVLLRDLHIEGFGVGVVTHPSGSDGNGDFVQMEGLTVRYCPIGVSISQTQARNMTLFRPLISNVHTAFTNNLNGKLTGRIGEVIDGHVGNSIQIFRISGTALNGPLTFRGLYSELMWRGGDVTGSTSSDVSIHFDGSHISMDGQNIANQISGAGTAEKGVPASCFNILGNNSLIFTGGTIIGFHAVCPILTNSANLLTINGTRIERSSTPTDLYEKAATHATCGGLITHNLGGLATAKKKPTIHPKWIAYNVNTGASIGQDTLRDCYLGGREFLTPIYAKFHAGYFDTEYHSLVGTPPPRSHSMSLVSSSPSASNPTASLSGRTLTLTFSGKTDGQFMQLGGEAGDIIFDPSTGTTFFVSGRSGQIVTAEMQNNFRDVGSGYVPITPINLTSGIWYLCNTRAFTPATLHFGDFTAGSPTITNVGRWDNNCVIEANVSVGDMLNTAYEQGFITNAANAIITGRSNSGKTITLSGNSGRTQTRVPLWNWFRTL